MWELAKSYVKEIKLDSPMSLKRQGQLRALRSVMLASKFSSQGLAQSL